MSSDSEQLVVVTANGLYRPPGDFYIDPWKPVPRAVITHAHADHLRHGSARYILARPGASIAKLRLGGDRDLAENGIEASDLADPRQTLLRYSQPEESRSSPRSQTAGAPAPR